MKFLKHTGFLMLALLAICLLLLPAKAEAAEVASGTCGEDLTWSLDDAGLLTISGTGAMSDYTVYLMAPWYSIRTSITAVLIEDGVTTIGDRAFYDCNCMTTVVIPNSVTAIGEYAFYDCSSLDSVTIPGGVTVIETATFCDCSSLTTVNMPNSITTIGYWAFRNCAKLTSVEIPQNVTCIGEQAFCGCAKLPYVTLPANITAIGSLAFDGCSSMSGIWVDKNNAHYSSDDHGVLFNKEKTELIRAPEMISGVYVVPNSVTVVYRAAFAECDSLTHVIMQDGVTKIDRNAFHRCTGLISVSIPDSITEIGVGAFDYCLELVSVKIPTGLTQIYMDTFRNCWSLVAVTLPDSVTSIGNMAFYNCGKLSHVAYSGTQTQQEDIYFDFNNSELKVAAWHYETSLKHNDNCVESSVYCPVCEELITQTVREGGAHSFANGKCTVCGTIDPNYTASTFDIDVARMILGNSLEFQFGIEAEKIPDPTGYYAIVEKSCPDGTVTQKTVPATEWGKQGSYHAISYNGLNAKEMADEITVTVYNADGQAVSDPKTDSVRAYVLRAYDSQSETGKIMMVDMLNYGAAAQEKFGYGTDDLANSQLTDGQKAVGTAAVPEIDNRVEKGTNYLGTRFILESCIQVQLAFADLTEDMYAIYSYTDGSGQLQQVRVEGRDFITAGSMKGVELSALVYADARKMVEVVVYNADGTVHGSAVESIESCAARSTTGDDVFVALMRFADSAKAHLYG